MSEHLKNVQFPVVFAAVWLEEITAATYDGSPRLDRDTNAPIWVLGVSAKLEGQARRVSLNVQVVSEQPPSVPVDAAVVLHPADARVLGLEVGSFGADDPGARRRARPRAPAAGRCCGGPGAGAGSAAGQAAGG